MSIAAHIGPYELSTGIGAGGMGEVFRAHDTRLERDVAIKVLPAAFAADKERVARFRREAPPYWVATDGSGKEGHVSGTHPNDSPRAPGPDPDAIIMIRGMTDPSGDVYLVSVSGAWKPRALLATKAYAGGLDRAWQVSEGGGAQAV